MPPSPGSETRLGRIRISACMVDAQSAGAHPSCGVVQGFEVVTRGCVGGHGSSVLLPQTSPHASKTMGELETEGHYLPSGPDTLEELWLAGALSSGRKTNETVPGVGRSKTTSTMAVRKKAHSRFTHPPTAIGMDWCKLSSGATPGEQIQLAPRPVRTAWNPDHGLGTGAALTPASATPRNVPDSCRHSSTGSCG